MRMRSGLERERAHQERGDVLFARLCPGSRAKDTDGGCASLNLWHIVLNHSEIN